MNGYLQALIDRYSRAYKNSDGEKRKAYQDILTDLHDMERYLTGEAKPETDAMKPLETSGQHKKLVFLFSGKMPDLMEELKKARREE